MACQNQATSNKTKVKVFHQASFANCKLCKSHDETVDHLLTSCSIMG